MRYAIFMAGGKGERFWPMSRASTPKHLLKIFEGKSLMELSVERVQKQLASEQIRVVTSAPQEGLMRATLPMLQAKGIVAEPVGRDTAAAVALATRLVEMTDPQGTIAMLPADHYIRDTAGFAATLQEAYTLAEEHGELVTIGIPPTRPATGYGYLQRGEGISKGAYKVKAFKEKPDAATAEAYLKSGEYFWNAGIFVWQVSAIVKALEQHAPDLWAAVKAIDPTNAEELAKVYPTLRKISVDYAIMEHAQNVVTLPARFDWDDVGEWSALARINKADAQGNIQQGSVVSVQSSNSIIVNEQSGHLLATLGASEMIIVHTKDATLVAPKAQAQELKELLKKIGAEEKLKGYL